MQKERKKKAKYIYIYMNQCVHIHMCMCEFVLYLPQSLRIFLKKPKCYTNKLHKFRSKKLFFVFKNSEQTHQV